MRRNLVLLMLAVLVGVNLAEAARGRLGRGAHSQQQRPVANPDPPPVNYVNVGTVTLATDAYTRWIDVPTASSSAYYTIYMDTTPDTHNYYVQKCDYTTGLCTKSDSLAQKNPSCCDAHDAPSIFRDPTTGKLWAFYGSISSGSGLNGPFYRVSTSGDDISAWDAEQRVPTLGSFSEITGGFDSSGNLLICGQVQWGNSEVRAFGLRCARRDSDGTWAAKTVVETTANGVQGQVGDPGCIPKLTVFSDGTAFLLFSRAYDNCVGSTQKDIFLLKTTDMGDTWTDVAGGNSFTPTASAGLTGTWDGTEHSYPTAYRVYEGRVKISYHSNRLSDGTPAVIFVNHFGGISQSTTYTEGAWTSPVTIVTGFANCLTVTAADTLLTYVGGANLTEYSSTDDGATWTATATVQSGGSNTAPFSCRTFSSLGGTERVIVPWAQGATLLVAERSPVPPDQEYFEILTMQTLAEDGYCRDGGGAMEADPLPEFGTDAVYVTYMTNQEGCGSGSRWHKVLKYDYTTGEWTASAALISGDPSGSDRHEAGGVFRNANGFLFLALGAVTAAQTGTFRGPFYYKSSSANSVAAWGSQSRLAVLGSPAGPIGGFQGTKGFVCGSPQSNQTGHVAFDWWCSYTDDGGDTWSEGLMVGDETGTINGHSNGSGGDPSACTRAFYMEPAPSTTMHIVWGGAIEPDGCGGHTSGGWYAKSTDAGATWTSITGTQSVSWPDGITPLSHDGTIWQWHTDYRIFTGAMSAGNPGLRVLSNGRPIYMKSQGGGGTAYVWVYSGSGTTWNQYAIATGNSACGGTLEVSDTGRVYAWVNSCSDIYQYTSDDNGATWSGPTTIIESSLLNFRLRSRSGTLGGKNRAWLTWVQGPGGSADATRSNVMAIDVVLQ